VLTLCIWQIWDARMRDQTIAAQAELTVVKSVTKDFLRSLESFSFLIDRMNQTLHTPGFSELSQDAQRASLLESVVPVKGLSSILLIASDGRLRSISGDLAPPALNFGDRDYFEFHRTHAEIALHLSGPADGRLSGAPVLFASKRLNDNNGRFAGVIVAGFTLSYFWEFFQHLDPGNPQAIASVAADGRVVNRMSPDLRSDSPVIDPISLFSHAAFAPSGTYIDVSKIDGQRRLISYGTIGSFPIIVSYARAMDDVLAGWLRISISVGAALLVSSFWQLFMIWELMQERRHRTTAEHHAQLSAQALLGINQDIEQRIAAEIQSKAKSSERLAKGQQLEVLGQLAGGIAHDFNNVLQTMVGACSLIQRRSKEDKDVHRLTTVALLAADRATVVTRRLLVFSRRAVIKVESVDTRAVLLDLQELLNHTLRSGISVELELADDVLDLLGDRMQFETIIINLATNARDAMPNGGTIVIAGNVDIVDGTQSWSAGLAPGPYVRLSIADTGVGMDEQTLARATEPFFSTKGVGEGAGLGLSMAVAFAEQSKGKLEISSRAGEGTTVSLWLPACKSQMADAVPPQMAVTRLRSLDSSRVLIVDDNVVARQLVNDGLTASGFQVYQAQSGAAALSEINAGLRVDLLLTDLSLPHMDGIELIRAIRRKVPDLPAIILTSNTGAVADLAISDAVGGRCFVLRKPIRVGDLVDHIELALGGGVPRFPTAAATRTLRMLVVDDVAMNRDIAGSFLRAAGYEVLCVEGGAEAIAAVANADFDVVLMDVRMPEMDGLEATRRIRALEGSRGQVPVVALTALARTEQIAECHEAGMNRYLAKPFNADTLLAVVQQTIEA
jgi:CheY-like chemotaxis protein